KQVEREERERRRAEHAETKRVKRMLEEEERKARQKQLEIDKETERLKREFEKEQRLAQRNNTKPPLPPGRPNANLQPNFGGLNYPQPPVPRPHSASPYGPYMQPPGRNAASSSAFFGGPSTNPRPPDGRRPASKPSFFNFLGHSGHSGPKLTRKQSAVF
ncbi:MAG: hypothetical protein Q9179_003972, partial [Wetmoreana sp. 5 TL-2023]